MKPEADPTPALLGRLGALRKAFDIPVAGIDVWRLAWAEHLVDLHGAWGTAEAEPCYHTRGLMGDPGRMRIILHEYEWLTHNEYGHDRAACWTCTPPSEGDA